MRQRAVAIGALAVLGTVVGLIVAQGGHAGHHHAASSKPTKSDTRRQSAKPPAKPPVPASFAVGIRVLHLVDTSRTMQLPNGSTEPRTLVTYVRYPALGSPSQTDMPDAPAASADGPFPLVVFGHGYALSPRPYAGLLQAWARAGYVVAAPVFPLENENAPGGPNESDLPNQPDDMRFVISGVLAAGAAGSGPLAGVIDPAKIAVAGHSDGGDTALAVAYNSTYRDPRVGAAIILSGAEIPGVGGFSFPSGSPPLLATQGTADTINPPSFTSAFFDAAKPPKYRLDLLGAEHLPPYTEQQPQLMIVEQVTTAFLDAYLKHKPGALARIAALGNVSGSATLLAEP